MQMFGKCQTSVEGASNAEKRKELHSEKFIVQANKIFFETEH